MKSYVLLDILRIIKYSDVIGNKNASFRYAKPIEDADENSVICIEPGNKLRDELIRSSLASIIITDDILSLDNLNLNSKCVILTENPRNEFLRVISALLLERPKKGVHESAVIHKKASIQIEVSIGPNSYIGKCSIGKGSIIQGNCYIHDNTIIGEDVKIQAGVVIGSEGFCNIRNYEGELESRPFIGGVIIEDNVDIGANTCIDRGTIGNTIIGQGAKIDKFVQIGYNAVIGKHSEIKASVKINNSVVIKDYAVVSVV